MAVIGAGSWGTALAVQAARSGYVARLWTRDSLRLRDMQRARCNERYLPAVEFPPSLEVATDIREALEGARDVLVVVPSQAFRATLQFIEPLVGPDMRLAWATKGFELSSGLLPHQVAAEVVGLRSVAVLSGPTFAREVGAGLPTAMTVAARDQVFAQALAERLSGAAFRVYMQSDLIGVEVGGAVKNVIAIGSGIADGMGFGANTRVALITRGLAEMMRLGVKLGAARETFMGLAGLGDLVLTCTDDQSRNRRLGLALGQGLSLARAQAAIGPVIEGILAARAVCAVATREDVDMPICREISHVMHDGKPAQRAVRDLMNRDMRSESDV
ncbi:MAG: NAD(P)H-dependent glycerol-3-phosphate dehydrogenase [Steroidobacteraceae bacterium]